MVHGSHIPVDMTVYDREFRAIRLPPLHTADINEACHQVFRLLRGDGSHLGMLSGRKWWSVWLPTSLVASFNRNGASRVSFSNATTLGATVPFRLRHGFRIKSSSERRCCKDSAFEQPLEVRDDARRGQQSRPTEWQLDSIDDWSWREQKGCKAMSKGKLNHPESAV